MKRHPSVAAVLACWQLGASNSQAMKVGRFRLLSKPPPQAKSLLIPDASDELKLETAEWLRVQFSLSMSMSLETNFPTGSISNQPTSAPTPFSQPNLSQPPVAPGDDTPTVAPLTKAPISGEPSFPTSGSNQPTATRFPSASTTKPTTTGFPSMPSTTAPSVTKIPSSISNVPTLTRLPSSPTPPPNAVETQSPRPTVILRNPVFACTPEGVVLAEPPINTTTVIDISVGFNLETLSDFEEISADLNDKIIKEAIIGGLDCNNGGPVFGGDGEIPEIAVKTQETEQACSADFSFCRNYVSEFQFFVNEDVDPDLTSFLSYVRLQESMDSGRFVDEIPRLDRVEYVSPLPLLTPLASQSATQAPILQSRQGNTSVAAAAVATVAFVAGLAAMGRWQWNRRMRNNAHMALHEDESDFP